MEKEKEDQIINSVKKQKDIEDIIISVKARNEALNICVRLFNAVIDELQKDEKRKLLDSELNSLQNVVLQIDKETQDMLTEAIDKIKEN